MSTLLDDVLILSDESFERYRQLGINVALGTDTFPQDLISEMRVTGLMCRFSDGRRLGYRGRGDRSANPILHFHGQPGSRLEADLYPESVLDAAGARVISYDRAGMGNSDDRPARERAALADYREKGTLPPLTRVPTIPISADANLLRIPWVLAGGQVWVWLHGAWEVASPQPAVDGGLLAGSPCAARGYHEMEDGDERHSFCLECDETVELIG